MKFLVNLAFIPVNLGLVAIMAAICLILVPVLVFMDGVTTRRWPWTVIAQAFREEFYV